MIWRSPEELATQLNQLYAKAVTIVEGQIAHAVSPGGAVTFTYINPIDGQTYTGQGVAFTECPPSRVSALRLPDGSWVVVGVHARSFVSESIHTLRRARQRNQEPLGKIKVLFLTLDGSGHQTFWLGGYKSQLEKVFQDPSIYVFAARLDNLGRDRYLLTLAYADGPNFYIKALNQGGELWRTSLGTGFSIFTSIACGYGCFVLEQQGTTDLFPSLPDRYSWLSTPNARELIVADNDSVIYARPDPLAYFFARTGSSRQIATPTAPRELLTLLDSKLYNCSDAASVPAYASIQQTDLLTDQVATFRTKVYKRPNGFTGSVVNISYHP